MVGRYFGLSKTGHDTPPESSGLSRREFLKIGMTIGAAASGGLLLGFVLPARGKDLRASVIKDDTFSLPEPSTLAPNAFVEIDRDGGVTFVMPKVEMGQGIYTSIPMLIADELEVPLSNVRLLTAPPDGKKYGDPGLGGGQITGGSRSIRFAWEPMRQAGATARTLLVAAAAAQWQVAPSACRAENGEVIHQPTGRRMQYGQLVQAAARLPIPKDVKLKEPKEFKLIGTRAKRLDSPEKVNGAAQFGFDVRVPGMLYAAIVNCPVFGGTVASVDDTATRKVPGVRQVVRIDNAVAVVAEHTWAAKRGASALLIRWNEGDGAKLSTKQIVADLANAANRSGALASHEGDVDKAFMNAKMRVDADYLQPFLAHATMEPVNCTVYVQHDRCEIWVGTQVPGFSVSTVQRVTGLAPEKIFVNNFLLGGGFGRRLETDFIEQAVKIGKQVDVPVKVVWTREQDIQHDMYRPCYHDKISAGLDANGKPIAWFHRIAGSSIMARWVPDSVEDGVDRDAIEGAINLPYDLPNQRIEFVRQEPGHVPTAFWRGVGPTRSVFVVESFMDELAVQANTDPVAYRRALLGKSPRALHVLETAARAANWGKPLPKGSGRGISVMHAFGSFLSMVAEVTVENGEVRVDRAVCAVDCGIVVNPDTIEAQIQGGIIFGITAVLYSGITIKDGRVEQSNFTDYRMLRLDQTPRIEVHIIKNSEAPGGIGEPGTAIVAAAVTNAIYAATGTRLRTLPVGNQLRSA